MRYFPAAIFAVTLMVQGTTASAEPSPETPAPAETTKARPVPRRRAAKHDQARSEQVRGGRVHVMKDIWIVGRPQRPLSVLDTAAQRFSFPVGTARYSPRDRAFLPADTQERW